ncbi:CDP-glycerol glycerophosphotransferase family protein [Bacillus sp. C28GYM-DRY-1]|uniref:CDP-glycerol glycerophosphotransferase family protein n=1 Tax=Bacillus sp. C28GYM-DRY-1 TaxID=3062686 RepID=UPI002676D328|nr:CDP-glycerol glycerophosphotransferase family protein [Bacillus sp. C28GYM-DRY-1]MDO3659854.1 CDP-glycerol glycerophosphotransferase family protein [Bacillus sp. C28GYM-DRY-1]
MAKTISGARLIDFTVQNNGDCILYIDIKNNQNLNKGIFVLNDRNTGVEMSIPLIQTGNHFNVILNSNILFNGQLKDCLWDAYVLFYEKNKLIKKRIKVDSSILDNNTNKIISKESNICFYRTKKGNFSIQVNEFYINVNRLLTKIKIDGHFHFNTTMSLSYDTNLFDLRDIKIIFFEKKSQSSYTFDIKDYIIDEKKTVVELSSNIDITALYKHDRLSRIYDILIEFNVFDVLNQEDKVFTFPLCSSDLEESVKISRVHNKKIRCELSKKRNNARLRVNDYSLTTRFLYKYRRLKAKINSEFCKIDNLKKKYAKKVCKSLFLKFSKLPPKKNLIIFESFGGKQYSCNPRAIYEYMIENCKNEYKMIWSVNKSFKQQFDDYGIPYIRRFSVKWLYSMARAKYWVVNSRLPLWIPKPEHTTYLQTWHGTPLKKLAVDMDEVHMPGTTTKKYKRNFTKEASNWDFLISPNAYSSEIFARAFKFKKNMLETGYPRNDFLYNQNNIQQINSIKRRLNIPANKKIILYAPTWRDDKFYSKGKYKFDLDLDLNILKQHLGDDYIIVLRMHYLVAENFDLSKFENFAFDFSNHGDIRDLYIISDLLITDYSSVFFDFANLKRPIIFYVPDIDEYRDKLRGFYFDFEKKAPGPLIKTTMGVIKEIYQLEENNFGVGQEFDEFYEKFCYLETGDASKKVVNSVFEK